MPLVAHSDLPTFERLRQSGQEVLSVERAHRQDIRELHVGLLNMMPDAALQATERQFLRLLGACNRIVQFHVHPFVFGGLERHGAAREYVERYYEDFAQVRAGGLDALIITGANPLEAEITREAFWEPLIEVMNWAREEICSTYVSCLATHAAFRHEYGIDRTRLANKRWGVYSHRVVDPTHPLVANINTRFDAPHSRFNDVPGAAIEAAGLRVLIEGEEAGVLAAVSPDRLRFVYFQGHTEYDSNSLLKEYKREVVRYANRERDDYPPYPEHYFPPAAITILERYQACLGKHLDGGEALPPFVEDEIARLVDNTWLDTGKAIFNNWLGLVYQLTHLERGIPFQAGIDPRDPLGLRQREADLHPCRPHAMPG